MTKEKKKGAKKNLWRRTLHYYWRATKKHKLLFVIGILVTPIVVASRTVLTPYFTADIIGKISSGIDPVAEWSTLMPSIVGLLACYLIGSELLGHVRIWAIWKLELKVAYDLATYCFDKVCTQFSANVSQYLMSIFQFHFEHCVRKGFYDYSFLFDC